MNNIVNTTVNYTSDVLRSNILLLKETYPFLDVFSIGKSVLGVDIPCIKIGNGKKEVFYNAAMHANEWITSVVLMKFVEDLCIAYVGDSNIFGYSTKAIFDNCTIYIAPMCNPDGVDLVTGRLSFNTSAYINANQIANNYPSIPFPSGWKANMQGIDLNLQFPAGWENARQIKSSMGINSPAPRDFVGLSPLVAPESVAIYRFTRKHNFSLILAYHTQGEEIYWQFENYASERAKEIGKEFARVSGYTLADVPYESSFAGYKDWFLQEYAKPGFTVEAGLGESPLPISQFDKIYRDNIGILVLGTVLS
ncbi:MAG: M14 family metallocarboxypeptidase [Oscillospiraceae bacterium]|nr:M14 family metallocarboxypeptidase [Oscillospiraceae bacterium]